VDDRFFLGAPLTRISSIGIGIESERRLMPILKERRVPKPCFPTTAPQPRHEQTGMHRWIDEGLSEAAEVMHLSFTGI
jgi:hypothetical protein